MGRQFRSPRERGVAAGDFREFVGPTPGSTEANATMGGPHVIPSYGVTDISTWGASTYYMAPPTQGCMKTIVSHSSAPAARVIKLSTNKTVTILYPGATTGASGNTHIAVAASTLDTCLTLMGLNSTHWLVVSVHPALNSTGTAILST
jgi:hypothetical protein